jgi:carbon storage regulator
MLILSRKEEEIIRIGDDISIVVVAINGDKVRLGIAAPSEIPVHRQEIYEAIQRDKEANQPPLISQDLEQLPASSGQDV